MIDIADFAVGQARMLYGKTMHSERPGHRMYEQWHPLGVVGVITAFNFPVAVWAWNALLSAVCGNATVWKPSPKTPLAAIAVQQLCNRIIAELNLPPIFTLLIDSGRDAAARLAADPRVSLVSFTGSSAVGRQIAQVVAGRFGRCLLECSGNNAIIVAADADLELVIPAVVFGAVGTAGQRCTTTRRLLVHESIEPEVVRRLEAAYAQVPIGDPLEPSTSMGPLIDAAAVAAFARAVEEARAAGGAVVRGGKARTGPGFFVEPTIVRNARNDWPVVQRWPAVPTAPKTTAGMTSSRSASAATMIALLPEHSRRQRPNRPATTWAICLPTADDPVNESNATRGSAASRAPASRPASMSSVKIGGRSSSRTIRLQSCWTAIAASGVFGDGFQTVALPHTAESNAFHAQTATGKLNAVITPTTPNGCHCSYIRCPGRSECMVLP